MGEGEVCVAVVSEKKRDHEWLIDGEPVAKKQAKECEVDNSQLNEPVERCPQICESKETVENLDCGDVCPSAEASVKVGSDEMELDPSGGKRSSEVLNDVEIEPIVEQPVKDCLNEMEPEHHGRMQKTVAESDIDLDLCGRTQKTADRGDSELELVKECSSDMEAETCGKNKLEVIEEPKCESKQTVEILDCADVCPKAEQSVKLGFNEMELNPCGEKRSSEVLNDVEIDPIVEQPVKDCFNEMEPEHHGRMQKTADRGDSELELVKECLSDMEAEACGKSKLEVIEEAKCQSKQTVEILDCADVCPSAQQSVKLGFDEMELGPCGEKRSSEVLNDVEIDPIVEQPVKDCLIDVKVESATEHPVKEETEASGKMQAPQPSVQQRVTGCSSEMETESCGKMEHAEPLNEIKPEPSVQHPVKVCPSETQMEACVKMESAEALDETEPKSSILQLVKDSTDEMEFEGLIDAKVEFSADFPIKEYKHEVVTDPCIKKEVKEASNDDICSEVLNPIVSPCHNSSFQTVNSQPDEKLVMKNQVISCEITSGRSGNSSSEGCSGQEEKGSELTSHVVIEAPKDAITSSGVRKITFKFSKRKVDFDTQPSASVVPGKAAPDSYPTSVKKLLSTGILDGAKVKYISTSAELIGIVKDGGYLCGCDTCNFSNVLRAHEFEEHAGGRKTSHPNKHIYMENGKSIYRIIQAVKTAPLGRVDEVIKDIAGSSVNEELFQIWKASLPSNMDMAKTDNSHHMKLMNLYHPPTSYTSEDGSSPFYNYRMSAALEHQTFPNEVLKERKCLFKKPKSYASSVAVETKQSAEGGHKKRKTRLYYDRDNDLHRLLFMPNGLPDGTALGYYAKGNKVLDGYKQGIGIVCSHCDDEISPSQFEAHAGWAAKRQPYRNIYVIPYGMALHDIALLLANGQSITSNNSDDMCAVCGDGGKLIICDGCPRAFHAACLEVEGLSSEDWQCPYCRDSIGSGRKAAAAESRPIVIRLSRVVKAREYEAGGCVICRVPDFSVAEFDDRTVMLCDQCEKEYHVGCLRESGRCDLKALPPDKWFCCDHCDMIHGAIQGVVANGAAVISGSVLSIINKKHIEKGLIYGVPNEIRWRMLSGTSRYPEHLPLLSRAAAIFRECFDPIVAKSGRDLIPVMVYGRNISGQDFGGIYCVVLIVGSVVVSAGLLRIFGREVAELPLVATSRQYQGKGYFQALFFCIEELLLSLGVELLVLPAAEEAESIWTKKLGFRKMSDERYTQFSRNNQLTIFKGTSMLERELHRTA